MPKYFFFADESGHVTQEPGISDDIGSSRYLSMGGVLISENDVEAMRVLLDSVQKEFKKSKKVHATEISHVQKVHLIRKIREKGNPFFGVVSDKQTLRGFKTLSDGAPQDYYNRTALYLLSLLGRHLHQNAISKSDVTILFEKRTHDYERFRNYVRIVARRPTGDGVDGIPFVDPNSIGVAKKDAEHLLAVPDIIAHAIFSAFDRNRNNFGITESRYLAEMMPAFCEGNNPTRFHLIQAKRINDVCEPTQLLLGSYGIKIAP